MIKKIQSKSESLYREFDKTLFVGETLTKTKQEFLKSIISGRNDVKGSLTDKITNCAASKKSIEQ